MYSKKRYQLLWLLCVLATNTLHSRSIHRPQDPHMPTINVSWAQEKKEYVLKNPHLEEYPLFKLFNYDEITQHLLPQSAITHRYNPHASTMGNELNSLIEQLLTEIKQKKKKYTHFDVLQKKGFNRRSGCGLLIAKFKEHPFVVKLFIETPKSFINPWAKGFEPIFFFYMGGGVNRHLSGFTRLKNLGYIRAQLAQNEQWQRIVDTPRKWFWLPQDPAWLTITGFHIGGKQEQRTRIPGIYAIVADAIEQERTFSSFNHHDMKTALELSTLLESHLDLHISNFMIEKNSQKIVIIDTEHFPTMVGLKEKWTPTSYISWFAGLIGKCAKDMLFCTKKELRMAQQHPLNALSPAPFALNGHGNRPAALHTAQLC